MATKKPAKAGIREAAVTLKSRQSAHSYPGALNRQEIALERLQIVPATMSSNRYKKTLQQEYEEIHAVNPKLSQLSYAEFVQKAKAVSLLMKEQNAAIPIAPEKPLASEENG